MRVLVDALSVAPGGGATVAVGLLDRLSELGSDDEYVVLVKDALLPGIRSWRSNVRFELFGRLATTAATRTLWEQMHLPRMMRKGGHDVLFGVGGFGMMRGSWPQLVIVQNALFYTRDSLRSAASRSRIRVQREAQLATLRAGATGVCVSAAIRDQLRPFAPRSARLLVIPNGIAGGQMEIDTDRYRQNRVPVILWVGSDAPHKNPIEMVDALPLLEDQGEPVEVRIVGALSDATQRSLEERAAVLGVASRLVFLGYLSEADLTVEYKRATVFVSTSRVEASPLPPVEAIVNGTPVVLSDIEAHREVSSSATSYVLGEPSQLAHGISELLSDPSLRRRVAEMALQDLNRPTWQATAVAYREEFERVAAGQNGASPTDSREH